MMPSDLAYYRRYSAEYRSNMTPEQREDVRTYMRERARTPEARAKRKARKHKYKGADRVRERKRKYGLTVDDVNLMWINQLCACPICENDIHDPQKAHVDHDHKTGRIRGLLCRECNLGLGLFKDSAGACIKAAAYLQAP